MTQTRWPDDDDDAQTDDDDGDNGDTPDFYEYYDAEGRLMRGDSSADRFWQWVDVQLKQEE